MSHPAPALLRIDGFPIAIPLVSAESGPWFPAHRTVAAIIAAGQWPAPTTPPDPVHEAPLLRSYTPALLH